MRALANLCNERLGSRIFAGANSGMTDKAHRDLDAAVAAAYGWPAALSDEEILERLFELNEVRAGAQWPRSHAKRVGCNKRQRIAPMHPFRKTAQCGYRLIAPYLPVAHARLFRTGDKLSIEDVAKAFAQGKSIEKRVELTVSALTRLGHLTSTDGAKTFALRRAA